MKKILTAILLMIIQSFPVYSQQNIIKGTHNNMPLMENRISHLGLPKVLNDVNGEALEKIHVKFNHSKSGDYESDDIIFHEYQLQESSTIFTFEKIPVQFQLYAREENDTAQVVYSGSTTTQNIDSVFLKTIKNGVLIDEQSQMLNYSGNKGTFNFSQGIHAELSKYSFQLYYKKQGEMFLDNEVADVVCGDVLIIQGQSNAEATRSWAGNIDITNDYIRSLGQMNSGNSSTWAIAHAKSKGIGGIGAWGMVLCDSLVKKYQIPQAVFNGAKGGKPVTYFIPGTANYNHLRVRILNAGLEQKVRAILWYQGESDCRNDQYISYASNWKKLYDGWKNDFPGFEKIYFLQVRPMGSAASWPQQQEVREAQRTIKDKYNIDEITYLATAGIDGSIGTGTNYGGSGGYDDGGQHYDWHGYQQLAFLLFPLVSRDLYGETAYNDSALHSAMILKAAYSKSDKTEITLTFDQDVVWDAAPINAGGRNFYLRDHIYLDWSFGKIESGKAEGNKIILNLKSGSSATKITYTPDWLYNDMLESNTFLYKGSWIKGTNGAGALTFQNVKIEAYDPTVGVFEKSKNESIIVYPNPASNTINIRGLNEDSVINITNLAGVKLKTYKLNSGNQLINLDDISPGIYLVIVENLPVRKKIVIL